MNPKQQFGADHARAHPARSACARFSLMRAPCVILSLTSFYTGTFLTRRFLEG